MKILIVEDEQKTGDYLKQGLSEAGFVADLARDGVDGLHLALSDDYDLMVLDVMLQDSTDGRCCGRSGRKASTCRYCS
jgi:two-component system copper resistance phosphate regulon response regulator CusR